MNKYFAMWIKSSLEEISKRKKNWVGYVVRGKVTEAGNGGENGRYDTKREAKNRGD